MATVWRIFSFRSVCLRYETPPIVDAVGPRLRTYHLVGKQQLYLFVFLSTQPCYLYFPYFVLVCIARPCVLSVCPGGVHDQRDRRAGRQRRVGRDRHGPARPQGLVNPSECFFGFGFVLSSPNGVIAEEVSCVGGRDGGLGVNPPSQQILRGSPLYSPS